jgi:hypothetical protein
MTDQMHNEGDMLVLLDKATDLMVSKVCTTPAAKKAVAVLVLDVMGHRFPERKKDVEDTIARLTAHGERREIEKRDRIVAKLEGGAGG